MVIPNKLPTELEDEEEMPLNDLFGKEDKSPLAPLKRESNHSRSSDDSEVCASSFNSIMNSSMNSIATFESIAECFKEDDDSASVSQATTDGDLSLDDFFDDVDQGGIDDMLGQVESMLEAAVMTTIKAKFKSYRESNDQLKAEQASLSLVMTKMKSRIEQLEEDTETLTEKCQQKQEIVVSLKEELDLQSSKVEMLQDMLKWRGPVEEQKFKWKLPSFTTSTPPSTTTTTTRGINSKLPAVSSNPQTDEDQSGRIRPRSASFSISKEPVERGDSKLEILQKMMTTTPRAPPGRTKSWTRKPPRATNSWSVGQTINAPRDDSRNIAACAETDASDNYVVTQEDYPTTGEDEDDSTNEVSEGHKHNLLI